MLWLTLGLLGALSGPVSQPAEPGPTDAWRSAPLRVAPGFSRATGTTIGRVTGTTIGFVVDDVGLEGGDVRRVLAVIARETAGLDTADVITRLTSGTPRRPDGGGRLLDTVASMLDEWTGTPGRKGLVIFSAGIVAKAAPAPGAARLPDAAIMSRLRAIVRAAASASAVLYPVNVPRFDAWVASRHALLDSPYDRAAEGPGFLADATGGIFFKNPGDLAIATARAVADQQGYYRLGNGTDDAAVPAGARGRPPARLPD